MSRKEYTHVRLELPVYDTLKSSADKERMSISRLIERMLTTSKNDLKNDIGETIEGLANPVFRKELGGSSPPLVAYFFPDAISSLNFSVNRSRVALPLTVVDR